jgi:hypothetical protein
MANNYIGRRRRSKKTSSEVGLTLQEGFNGNDQSATARFEQDIFAKRGSANRRKGTVSAANCVGGNCSLGGDGGCIFETIGGQVDIGNNNASANIYGKMSANMGSGSVIPYVGMSPYIGGKYNYNDQSMNVQGGLPITAGLTFKGRNNVGQLYAKEDLLNDVVLQMLNASSKGNPFNSPTIGYRQTFGNRKFNLRGEYNPNNNFKSIGLGYRF